MSEPRKTPAEIINECLADWVYAWNINNAGVDFVAPPCEAIIEALEEEGYRIVGPDATADMLDEGGRVETIDDSYGHFVTDSRAVWKAMHAAAIRWTDPSE